MVIKIENNRGVSLKGKIIDFSLDGYIGFQNHDCDTEIFYNNIKCMPAAISF